MRGAVKVWQIGIVLIIVAITLLVATLLIHHAQTNGDWVAAFKDAADIVASISIATGLIGFWISAREYLDAARQRADEAVAQAIRDWQKVTVHIYLQKMARERGDEYVKFDEILSKYREEGGYHPRLAISKSELSPDALRQVLLEMLADRIIAQNGKDAYAIEDWGPADDQDDDE